MGRSHIAVVFIYGGRGAQLHTEGEEVHVLQTNSVGRFRQNL
jgi:hypothetical protein